MYPKYNPTYDETKIIKLHYKHMQIHSRAPCNKLISQNNQVWWTHVNKHREADTWSSKALKQTRDESVSCQMMHKVAAIFPPKKWMFACVCTRVHISLSVQRAAQQPGQAVVD